MVAAQILVAVTCESKGRLRAALTTGGMMTPTHEQLLEFVTRLASMPSTDEAMLSTFSPPEWDDLSDWWRDYVAEARKLTGVTYRGRQ